MSGSTEKTTKSRTDPAKWLMPHIGSVLGGARDLYATGQPTYAQFSPTTQRALSGIEQRAADGSPVFRAGQQNLQDTIEGQYLTPDANPYLRQYGDALAGHIQDRVNAEFSKAGRYGSGAHAGTTAREVGNVLSGLYGNAYAQERGLQANATQQAPYFAGKEYMDLQNMLTAGQQYDAKAQQGVDDPYNQILRYMSIISGVPQGREGYEKVTEKQNLGALDYLGMVGSVLSPMSSSLGSIFGGGAAAGAGSALAGASAGASAAGATTGIASSIGTLAASDPALKENIEPAQGEAVLDKLRKLPVSNYHYKDGAKSAMNLPEARTGPMADDYARLFGGDGHTIDMADAVGNMIAAIKALDKRTRGGVMSMGGAR